MPDSDLRVDILFCGFGAASEAAAIAMLRRDRLPCAIRVLTEDCVRCEVARSLGLAALHVPHLRADILDRVTPGISMAIIELDDDAALARFILAFRARFPGCLIMAASVDPVLSDLLVRCGATKVVCVSQIAGRLLAETADTRRKPLRQGLN